MFIIECMISSLQVEPFLHLSSSQSAHLYQLFVEKDEGLGMPWFQQILEQSFFHQDLKLRQLPSVFIVQMPRFGRQFKVRINQHIEKYLWNYIHPCCILGDLAQGRIIFILEQLYSAFA